MSDCFSVETLESGFCFGVQCHCFPFCLYLRFRSAGEVTCGETAKRREELPHLLSASVWCL